MDHKTRILHFLFVCKMCVALDSIERLIQLAPLLFPNLHVCVRELMEWMANQKIIVTTLQVKTLSLKRFHAHYKIQLSMW